MEDNAAKKRRLSRGAVQVTKVHAPVNSSAADKRRVHGCYLLAASDDPKKTYVGYTVNPERRLRQHNGELAGGAKHSKRLTRSTEARYVCFIEPFIDQRTALQ